MPRPVSPGLLLHDHALGAGASRPVRMACSLCGSRTRRGRTVTRFPPWSAVARPAEIGRADLRRQPACRPLQAFPRLLPAEPTVGLLLPVFQPEAPGDPVAVPLSTPVTLPLHITVLLITTTHPNGRLPLPSRHARQPRQPGPSRHTGPRFFLTVELATLQPVPPCPRRIPPPRAGPGVTIPARWNHGALRSDLRPRIRIRPAAIPAAPKGRAGLPQIRPIHSFQMF